MVDLLNYFLFQPLFQDWCNRGRAMVYINDALIIIRKTNTCSGGSGFPLAILVALYHMSDAILYGI